MDPQELFTATEDTAAPGEGAAAREWNTNPQDPKWKQILDVLTVSPDAKSLQRRAIGGALGGVGWGPLWPVGALLGVATADPDQALGDAVAATAVQKLMPWQKVSQMSRGAQAAIGAVTGVGQTAAGKVIAAGADALPINPLAPKKADRSMGSVETILSAMVPAASQARAAWKASRPGYKAAEAIRDATSAGTGVDFPLAVGGQPTTQPITRATDAVKREAQEALLNEARAVRGQDLRVPAKSALATQKIAIKEADLSAKEASRELRAVQSDYNSALRIVQKEDVLAGRATLSDYKVSMDEQIGRMKDEIKRMKAAAGLETAEEAETVAREVYGETENLQLLARRKGELMYELKNLKGSGGKQGPISQAEKDADDRIAAIREELDQINLLKQPSARFEPGLTKIRAGGQAATSKASTQDELSKYEVELARVMREKQATIERARAAGIVDPERLTLPPHVIALRDRLAQAKKGYDDTLGTATEIRRQSIATQQQLDEQNKVWAALEDTDQEHLTQVFGAVGKSPVEFFDAAWGAGLRGFGPLDNLSSRIDQLTSSLTRAGFQGADKSVRTMFMHDLLEASRDAAGYPTKLQGILDRMGPGQVRELFPKLFTNPGQKPGEAQRLAGAFLGAAGQVASLVSGRAPAPGIHLANGYLTYEALKPVIGPTMGAASGLLYGLLRQVNLNDIMKKAAEDPIAVETFLRYTNKYGLRQGLAKSKVAQDVFKSLPSTIIHANKQVYDEFYTPDGKDRRFVDQSAEPDSEETIRAIMREWDAQKPKSVEGPQR